MITLDLWPQIIYLEALGTRTIKEFVLEMASEYKKVPARLDELTDGPTKLPYYLEHPQSLHDEEKAKRLMREDGYLKI